MTTTYYSTKELAERLSNELGYSVTPNNINKWRFDHSSSVPRYSMRIAHVLGWHERSVGAWVKWIGENTRAGRNVRT